jgi:CIC family chloride channel protein
LAARLGFQSDWYLLVIAAVIGLLMSLVATAFIWPLKWVEQHAAGLQGDPILFWLILLAPCAGGLAAGIVIQLIRSEFIGPGVTTVIYSVNRQKSRLNPKIAIRKWICSTLTIASGGSAGAEGPIVAIGAVIGSNLARLTRLSTQNTSTLLGCGAAAGIASVFNAPIAGIFFVLEILLRDFSLRTFTPIVIASVVSAAYTQAMLGDEAIFAVGGNFVLAHESFRIIHVPSFVILGTVCGLLAVTFIGLMGVTERCFNAIKVPAPIKPALGGLAISVLALIWLAHSGSITDPPFFGNGYPVIEKLLSFDTYYLGTNHQDLTPAGPLILTLLILLVMKLVGTCLTLGSGGAGGLFAPALLIGATAGGLVGVLFHVTGILPSLPVTHCALVGMAAMVAAVTHAPLTAILIVYELTHSYEIILPLMLAAVVSTIVGRLFSHDSIYTAKLRRHGVRIGVMSDLTILRRLTVEDLTLSPPVIVHETDPVQYLVELTEQHSTGDFIVLDQHEHVVGMVTAEDLKEALVFREAIPLLQVSELLRANMPIVRPGETLDIVLDKFTRCQSQSLAVITDDAANEILGQVSRSQLMQRYQAALNED